MGDNCIHNLQEQLKHDRQECKTYHEVKSKLLRWVIIVIPGIYPSLLVVGILEMCKWASWDHRTGTLDPAGE